MKLLCQVDQSGAEALIVAYECRPGRYRSLFENGIKPHVYLGLQFYQHWEAQFPAIHEIRKLSIPDIPKHPGWKSLAKAIKASDDAPAARRFYYLYKQTCHSSNYAIKAKTFQSNLLEKSDGEVALSNYEAEVYLQIYHDSFPEIREWNASVVETVQRTGFLRNLFGFPREFTGFLWDEESYKEWLAFIPQSTVGCITNIAQVEMQQKIELEKLDWDILNNKHDSFLCQSPEGEITTLATTMKTMIERDLVSSRGDKFRMKSEVYVGKNWGKCSETNPEGLKEIKLAA